LSRYGRAQPRQLGSINLVPNTWPTAAVIDWLNVLKRVPADPARDKRLEEAQQILRARLTYAGTTLRFSTEESDFWWWLMDSADANAARSILAVLDDPGVAGRPAAMVVGSLARQRRGRLADDHRQPLGIAGARQVLGPASSRCRWPAAPWQERVRCRPARRRVRHRPMPSALPTGLVADWSRQANGASLKVGWPAAGNQLEVVQDGAGKPWLTVQSLAAIPLKAPLAAGYAVVRSTTAVERKDPGRWSRGDIIKVRLEIDAQSDMTWVVVSDPVPGGATILGSGLGRDSQIATRTEKREGSAWPAFEERGFEAFRAYYEYLPRGRHVVEYTVRLNNPGRFALPPTRRRGDVRAGELRRGAERQHRGRAVTNAGARRLRRHRWRAARPAPPAWAEPRRDGRHRERHSQLRRGEGRASTLRPDPARPARHADPDRPRRQGGAAPRLDPARRHVAGPAARDRAQRGPALSRTRRRRLAGGDAQRLGQSLEHAHARRIDADDAAAPASSLTVWRAERRAQRLARSSVRCYRDAASSAALEEERDASRRT
jgi:hypothetical protein